MKAVVSVVDWADRRDICSAGRWAAQTVVKLVGQTDASTAAHSAAS